MRNSNMSSSHEKNRVQSATSVIKFQKGDAWAKKSDLLPLLPLPRNLISTGFNSSRVVIDSKDVVNVPEVNGILSEYAKESLQIQYTIEFVEYVNQQFGMFRIYITNEKLNYAVNLYRTINEISIMINNDEVQKTLSPYLDNPLSLTLLKSSLAKIAKTYIDKLMQVSYVYQNKTTNISRTIAAQFINLADTEIEKDLNNYFAAAQGPTRQVLSNKLVGDPRFNASLEDSRWNEYDDTIKSEVAYYNEKFKNTPSFRPLDWRLVKAMVWTEVLAGPKGDKVQWEKYPLQIGRFGADPGYAVVKSGRENSDLVTSADFRRQIQTDVTGKNNIRAGIAYLYTRAMEVSQREVVDNANMQAYKIIKGDTIDKVAKTLGTTKDNIMKNSGLTVENVGSLKIGQEIKFQKAHIERYTSGWKDWTQTVNAYNGGGDPNYADKIERAYQIIKSRTNN